MVELYNTHHPNQPTTLDEEMNNSRSGTSVPIAALNPVTPAVATQAQVAAYLTAHNMGVMSLNNTQPTPAQPMQFMQPVQPMQNVQPVQPQGTMPGTVLPQ